MGMGRITPSVGEPSAIVGVTNCGSSVTLDDGEKCVQEGLSLDVQEAEDARRGNKPLSANEKKLKPRYNIHPENKLLTYLPKKYQLSKHYARLVTK